MCRFPSTGLLLSFLLVLLSPQWALGQMERVTASGKVVDANGQPIAGAKVIVVGNRSYPRPAHSHTGHINGVADDQGEFTIQWRKRDRRFLQSSEVLIVAYDDASNMATTRTTLTQRVAAFPLRLIMIRSEKVPMRIVDERGEPIVGAEVSAAKIGSQTVPYGIVDPAGMGRSDGRGMVAFAGIASPRLEQVYVTGANIGNHRVDVITDAKGQRFAVIQRGTMLRGQMRWVDSEPPPTIDWSGLQLTFVAGRRGGSTYCWSEVSVSSSGDFITDAFVPESTIVIPEFPDDMAYVVDDDFMIGMDRFASIDPIAIPVRWATQVHGKIIHGANGSPVADILVETYEDRDPVFTNADGTFTTLHSSDRTSYYPMDVFGDLVMSGPYFVSPQETAVDHQVHTAPVSVQPRSTVVGRVVDQDGNGISGATIRCEYKLSRFAQAINLYSNADGRFGFPGIVNETAVSLTATTDIETGMMTPAATSLVLTTDASPVLIVKPRHPLRVRGRVVDTSGQAICDAVVNVRFAERSQPENHSGPDYRIADAFASAAPIMTDADGRFESPPTMEWESKVQRPDQSITKTRKIDLLERRHAGWASRWRPGFGHSVDDGRTCASKSNDPSA